jgi:kumamolisin
MQNPSATVPIQDSMRYAIPNSSNVGIADLDCEIEVTLIIKRRTDLPSTPPVSARISPRAFSNAYGMGSAALSEVARFCYSSGLQVVEVDRLRRIVLLKGPVARLSRAFGVDLANFKSSDGVFRTRTGPVRVPRALEGAVDAVFGLDNRPAAWPRLRWRGAEARRIGNSSDVRGFTAAQIARLYGCLPSMAAGDERIGIVELGGGFSREDLEKYCARIGLKTPEVSVVGVGGGKNEMGKDEKADGEVALDVQVAAAAAPGASIVVYFGADSSEQGYVNAFSTAVHDAVNRPTVISLSWGGPEAYCTRSFLTQFDQIAQEAGHLGITVCAASGDDGSYDLPAGVRETGIDLVDFPASSPSILACGGTRLLYRDGTSREEVWNDLNRKDGGASGGGFSAFFRRPVYQKGVRLPSTGQRPMRGVPDVAGNADPLTGYLFCLNGSFMIGGGTSAVAPLWAALVARLNSALKRQLGFVNPLLYAAAARRTFRDVSIGSNGGFAARIGWDPCTGLGTPRYGGLAAALRSILEEPPRIAS